MKYLLNLLFLFPHLSFSFQSDDIDINHYAFQLELNDSTNVISGTTEILLTCKKNTAAFDLDLISTNAEGKGMEVKDVKSNSNALKFTHSNDRLKIFLDREATAGARLALSITYQGIPQDGLIISKNKFGDRTFFADNWPNRGRNWLPLVDHPSDKATVDFSIIAPLQYEVIANGIRTEESYLNDRQKLTRYHEEAPIPTKVMVIGVARFAVQKAGAVDHIPVESWVYPQNRKEGFYDYAVAVKVLDFFINHVGPYSYGKLANVQSKTTFGGLENAGAIFYFENSVTGKNAHETLIAHEIAHQWFGNSASEKEWDHIWLSEGFATYFAHLYNEFTYGQDKRKDEMKKDRDEVIAFFKKDPMPVVNPGITDLMKLLNVNNYQKGSWVLHMLRQEIGEQDFWAGIREYYRQYRNGNALTSDFRHVMEAASGKDLKTFFDQWIHKAGHPVLDGKWKYDERAKTLKITVKQVQKGTIFSFPLEIGIYTAGKAMPLTEKRYINKVLQQFSIPLAEKPQKIALDPGVNLLFEGDLKN